MKKRILPLALALIMLTSMLTAAAAGDYSDVSGEHWAHDVIAKWSGDGYGVIEGNGDGTFAPSRGITLADLATILSRTFGYKERTAANVTPAWAEEYVQKAIAAGIIDAAETIDAGVAITREQAVRYIAIAYNIAPVSGDTTFADDASIGAEYKPYVNAFQSLEYIQGKPGNVFDPQAVYTRAEAMQLIENTTSEILDHSASDQEYARNVIIREQDVTLADTTIQGNLIIGQGVGDGDVTLDNVTVEGNLIVYGGGSDSIIITGGSQIAYVVLNKQGGDPANIRVESGSFVTAIEINSGSAARITGSVARVDVSANATLEIAEGSIIEHVVIDGEKVTVVVRTGATIQTITIEGDNVTVQGRGNVEAVVVEPGVSGAEVGTSGTVITNNGEGPVKTETGEVAAGATGTTPRGNSQGGNSQGGNSQGGNSQGGNSQGGNSQGGNSQGEDNQGGNSQGEDNQGGGAQPSTVTVNTMQELRDALASAATTINVPIVLQNYETDITIPAGKTVVFANNAGLRVNNLTINGTVAVNGSEAYIAAISSLSGAGLKAGEENGFFGLTAAYKPRIWRWFSEGGGIETTGFWPISVAVTDQAALTEAQSGFTIFEVHLEGEFDVSEYFNKSYVHIRGNITILPGVTAYIHEISTWHGSSLTVQGELVGVASTNPRPAILMYGNSKLTLDGTTYHGPDPDFFSYGAVARLFIWYEGSWLNAAMPSPRLYNVNRGQDINYADISSFDDIAYLDARYPELMGVHLGNYYVGIDLTADYTLTGTDLLVMIYGNVEELHGNIPPVTVGAGVTFTIGSDMTVELRSDFMYGGFIALDGVDGTSKVVIEDGATVEVYYRAGGGYTRMGAMTAGTWVWDTDTGWQKQP